MDQNAYALLKFCPWCGTELVYVETGIDDLKSCPKFMSHTISFHLGKVSENVSELTLDVSRIPSDEFV